MNTIGLIQNFSMPEILVVGLIIILFFGAKRLPDLFGSIGKSIGEFKRGVAEDSIDGVEVEVKQPISETSKSA